MPIALDNIRDTGRSGKVREPNNGYRPPGVKKGYIAATDSGMVSNYRPAVRVKPAPPLNAIQRIWNKMVGYVDPSFTTQQGSAAASPSVAQFQLYSLRYERWQVIGDCNNIYQDDPRAKVSVNMYVNEAVRKGIVISVSDTGERATRRRNQLAQQIVNGVAALCTPSTLVSWGIPALVEGELFLHVSTYQDQVINIERRPASSMERNTDDADEFVDVNRAFSQIDTTTSMEVATYPLWQIWHGKWDYMDGDKYGQSALVSIRRCYRLLEMIEEAQVRRRLSRAPQRKLWKVGTEKNPGTPDQVSELRNNIGMVEGNQSQYDPVNVAVDYFTNNLTEVQLLEGDRNVHEIEDLKYFENIYSAGLPTPGAIYNLASSDVNRDVLEDQRAQWLNSTRKLNDFLTQGIRWCCDVALMLQGIDPTTITYSVHWSESNTETPTEIINRTLLLLNNGTGVGSQNFVRVPLISFKRAISTIAEFTGAVDIAEEMAAIHADLTNNIGALIVPQQINGGEDTNGSTGGRVSNTNGPKGSPQAPKSPQIMGNEPLGGILHDGNSSSRVRPLKPIQTKLNSNVNPTLENLKSQSERGIGGASVGAGQTASNQSDQPFMQQNIPEY